MTINFDAKYYRRYYEDRRTRVCDPDFFGRIARFISAYANYLDVPVTTIADFGCGTGALGRALLEQWPRADFTGIETSAYACERYGWAAGSVVDWQAPEAFDLVVCHDVVQYLDDDLAAAAIANLTRHCAALMFFGVLTREDWDENCDQDRTDGAVFKRPADWYRALLKPEFFCVGGGLYVRRDAAVVLYALDRLD